MAMVEDQLSRYIQAMTLSFSWGSPLLASSAGTAASVHGTDPATWWFQAWQWPEVLPWRQALDAQANYSVTTFGALGTPSSKSVPEKPETNVFLVSLDGQKSAKRPDLWCSLRCGLRYPGRRDKLGECLVQECGADPETARKMAPQSAGLQDVITYAAVILLGVALVVAGAYALVS